MDEFETARLRMRPLGGPDEALYCRLYTTAELMRFIAPPLSMEAARRSFQVALRQQSPRPQRWIVQGRQDGQPIGLLGLVGEGDRPEIGVMLLATAHGRGIGGEAMQGMTDHAFHRLGLQSICARQSVVDNPIVVRMMTRLGYASLPPNPGHAHGGEWELPRARWREMQSRRDMARAGASR